MKRVLLLVAATCALGALAFGALVAVGLPPRERVRALARKDPGETALMRQREREAKARGGAARRQQRPVPLASVSRALQAAVVTAEDARFYEHRGLDLEAIRESVERDWRERRFARGGSTITQQLAKNLFFGTRRTLVRKAQELIVARWLEQDLAKPRILELYLNVIEWGDGVYGCEAAAWRYYAKPAAELDAREAAGLAAMIPNPRRINPEVDRARHARAQERVLRLMALAGQWRARGAPAPPADPEPADEAVDPAPEPTPSPDRE